jgi:hypothetical protein
MFDELDGRERQIMQPHMGSCVDCQAEQRSTQRVFMVVQTAVRSGGWVPDHFTETVISKLPPRSGKRMRHDPMNLRLMRHVLQMVVSVLVGVSVVGMYVVFYDHLPHVAPAAESSNHKWNIFFKHSIYVYVPTHGNGPVAVRGGVSLNDKSGK